MNKRLAIIAQKAAKETKKTCMLDAYNNSFSTDISVTITTRIYACNNYWIMEQSKINETQKPQQDYPKIKTDKMLNVITLFSGYDSQCLALNRLGLPYDLAAWCEIDKHAITAHNALFPQWSGRNLGDVSRVDWAEWHREHPQPIDLLTYSSPCQDFSSAGLQRGGEEGSGTRSGLLWETERAVRELRPRHLVFENVGGLVSDKFIDLFQRWQVRLNGYGYTNFSQLMNAKDYGVPQNRLRIFMVSILDCPRAYYFPQPFPLTRRLKDVLEQNVEERYYLSDERVAKLIQESEIHSDRGNGFAFRPHTPEEIASTVKCSGIGDKTDNFVAEPKVEIIADLQPNRQWQGVTRQQNKVVSVEGIAPACTAEHDRHPYKIAEPQIDTLGQLSSSQNSRIIGTEGISPAVINGEKDGMPKIVEPTILTPVRTEYGKAIRKQYGDNNIPESRHNLTTLQPKPDGTSNTLTSVAKDNYLMEPGIRIRRLTERELYRTMDVDETDIDTLLAAPIPRTQHAKLAGNSIVVACLYHIFRNLFVDTKPQAGTQTALF